jgi:uncharacterized protein YcaQ
VDVKAERKAGVLLLQKLTIEEAFNASATSSELEEFIAAFKFAVGEYAAFNNCQEWKLLETNLFSDLLGK